MEPVGTLKDIVIFELIRRKYKHSRLPAIISNIAYKERKFGEYATEDDKEILYRMIRRICKHWAIPGSLSYIKDRIAVCFRGLVLDILDYASGLAEDIKQYNTARVTLLIDSICLTQNGGIDKAKTVLTILKKTDFLLEFYPGILYHNYVMKEDLINAANEVLNAIKNKTNSKVSKIKANIEKVLEYQDISFIASDYYGSAAGVLFLDQDYEGVRKVCDMMTNENKIKFLTENHHRLVSRIRNLDPKWFMYLSINLRRQEWIEVLKNNFDLIFHVIIFDWRNRGYAVIVFQDSLDFIDFKLMEKILDFASSMYDDDNGFEDNDIYANAERILVLKSIWMNTPMLLRNDIKQQILKSNKAADYNAEFLKFVLESYPVSEQGEILSELMKDMGNSEYKRFSDYRKIFEIYTCLKTKSKSILVDEKITTAFEEEMNALSPKKKKN